MVAESVTLAFLQTHGYWILLFLFIIDGSIAALAGFAASLGIFNVYAVFVLAFLGGFLPDSMWFFLGKIGKKGFIEKYFGKKIKKFENSKLRKDLEDNYFKTLAVIKFTPYIQIPGFTAAGMGKSDYKRFAANIAIIDFLNAIIFTFGGFYFGKAFVSIFGENIQYFGFLIIGILVAIFILSKASRKIYLWFYKNVVGKKK